MPNHTANRLTINASSQERVDEIIAAIGRDVEGDFNRAHDGSIICRKDGNTYSVGWFTEETGSFRYRENGEFIIIESGIPDGWEKEYVDPYRVMIDFEKIVPPPEDPAYKDMPNQDVARSNPNWWYTWNHDHWGTKWNAYETRQKDDNVIYFETAWSPPIPVIIELAKKYPDVEFILEYIDEGWFFAGSTTFRNDEILEKEVECDSSNDEFCNMMVELRGYDPREQED